MTSSLGINFFLTFWFSQGSSSNPSNLDVNISLKSKIDKKNINNSRIDKYLNENSIISKTLVLNSSMKD